MGKYHPHGDSSIYESLVVMAQEFKKGMVLVDMMQQFHDFGTHLGVQVTGGLIGEDYLRVADKDAETAKTALRAAIVEISCV